MTPSILVTYASRNGSTREVAETVARVLDSHGATTTLLPVLEAKDLSGYDGVVLGGSIYSTSLQREAMLFLRRHRETLAGLPLAVFALGPIKDEPEEWLRSRKQLDASLAQVPGLAPVAVAVFGGVIDPSRLPHPMNRMPPSDNRDWDAIKAWAREATAKLVGAVPLA
jgi:menaquinone-dependent protoporphyrinogen oxidase